MSNSLTLPQALAFTRLLAQRFGQERAALNQLDSGVGDGDHGATMANSFEFAAAQVDPQVADLGQLFDQFAEKFVEGTGGAIGPVVGSFFAEGALVFRGMEAAGLADISRFVSGGLEAVQEVGSAEEGDKTLVDALAHAARAIQAVEGPDLSSGLAAAVEGARAGVQATIDMVAKRGRARFLQERSRGAQDAGATSLLFIFETLAAAAAGALPATQDEQASSSGTTSGLQHNFINSTDRLMPDNLFGFAAAYPEYVGIRPSGLLVRAHAKADGKVGLAMGHGGGHEPAMCGFIGYGLLDTDMTGPLFTCAPGTQIRDAIVEADHGAGVILLVSHHEGDVLNARLAVRQARQLGVDVRSVLLYDDIATAPRERVHERRGKGGMTFALKTAGAAAERGYSLDEVERIMVKTNDWTVALGVASHPPLHPATGEAMFELETGQMEVGVGGHGEAGIYQGDLLPAEKTMDLVGGQLLDDLPFVAGDEILVFLDSSGSLPMTELHALYLRFSELCAERGITVFRALIGEYYTTQQMGGFTLSLCKVDDELKDLWLDPANGAYFKIIEPGVDA
jgi:dihydroxyacetone kinase-like protein